MLILCDWMNAIHHLLFILNNILNLSNCIKILTIQNSKRINGLCKVIDKSIEYVCIILQCIKIFNTISKYWTYYHKHNDSFKISSCDNDSFHINAWNRVWFNYCSSWFTKNILCVKYALKKAFYKWEQKKNCFLKRQKF